MKLPTYSYDAIDTYSSTVGKTKVLEINFVFVVLPTVVRTTYSWYFTKNGNVVVSVSVESPTVGGFTTEI